MADPDSQLDPGPLDASTNLGKRKDVEDSICPLSYDGASKTKIMNQFKSFEQKSKVDYSGNPKEVMGVPNKLLKPPFAHDFRKDVKKLDLSGRDLTGLPPDFCEYCYGIEELNLSNNSLTHLDLYPIRRMHSLKKLDVSGCGLEEWNLSFLRENHGIEELNLSNNSLTQSDLCPIGRMRSLKKLDVSGCGLKKWNLSFLELCDEIEELNLSNNSLTRLGLYPIGRMRSLKKLDVSGCGLKEFPSDLENCANLQELNLSNNMFDHQDLLEELNSEKKFSLSERKLFGLRGDGIDSSGPTKIIFEDAIYIKSGGVWTRKACEDAAPKEESWLDEFCRIRKSEEFTIETYHSMLESMKILATLVGENKKIFNLKSCCFKIQRYLANIKVTGGDPDLDRHQYVRRAIFYLKKAVSGLINDTIGLKQAMEESAKALKETFEAFSYCSSTKDGLLAAELKIISKIMSSLTKPETAILWSLQSLQELHDLHAVRKVFSRLDREETDNSVMLFAKSVFKINKILFEFVQAFFRPPPSVEEWPVTIQLLDKSIYNPLIDKRLMDTENVVSRETKLDIHEVDNRIQNPSTDVAECGFMITESCKQTPDISITVDQKGGCFSLPDVCAFLLFPPNAVDEKVTLKCCRVKHKECKVKLSNGEVFVSRILKIEPEGVTFKKPVTVLLSHSLDEDQDFLYFYELIVENFSPTGYQELRTEPISSIEDVPNEICDKEVLDDYLPLAKVTIQETCTLAAATRAGFHQILIPTNRRYVFCKKYGDIAELKITFPAGITKEIVSLKVQLFPADAVVNTDIRLNKSLVCAPIIRLSGQNTSFFKPVHVELTYSHSDVANIEEEFLPVGKTIHFTTRHGLLLHNHSKNESKPNWQALNKSNNVSIERPRKDQLKLSFSVEPSDFTDVQPVVKTSAVSYVPPINTGMVSMNNPACHHAIVLAVHETGSSPKTLRAVLAPKHMKRRLYSKWKGKPFHFQSRLKCEEPIYLCIPMSDTRERYHLSIEDDTLRFDPDDEVELSYNTTDDVYLRGKEMRFLKDRECNDGENHTTQGDCRAKVPIHISESKSIQTSTGSSIVVHDRESAQELARATVSESNNSGAKSKDDVLPPESQEEKTNDDDLSPESQEEESEGDDLSPESQEEESEGDDLSPESQEEESEGDDLSPESQEEESEGDDLSPESQEEESEGELENKDKNKESGQISDNSIIVDQKGGCFKLSEVCAFLLFPPNAVDKKVTLKCSRVKYKECQVEPSAGEVFVSQILKIEPEGMALKKPVTVLLSHSLYEDQDFLYFYELVVKNLNPNGCQELKTDRISSIEDIPKEICNKEILDSYLPFAKTTIHETCTLVAVARIKSERISVPTNEICTFSKQYGNAAHLKFTFPAGVTDETQSLKIQLFPADAVMIKGHVRLNKNLVCGPVIRVSGQTSPFLKEVAVELTYSHSDVVNIKKEFLPVSGKAIQLTTDYGLLTQSQEEAESAEKLVNLNESNRVYIERPRTDQLKFSFLVNHFSDVQPVVKTDASVSHVPQMNSCTADVNYQAIYKAVTLAVHSSVNGQKTLHAVLAPRSMCPKVEGDWSVQGKNKVRHFNQSLRLGQEIFFCVPLSEHNDHDHLPIKDFCLRFDPDEALTLDNNADTDLRGKYMHFLVDKMCSYGDNHSTQGDCRAKAPIHIAESLQDNISASTGCPYESTPKPGIAENDHVIQSQNKVGSGSPEVLNDGESPQECNVSSDQGDTPESSNDISKDVIHRCELFETTVGRLAEKKLKIKKVFHGGKATKIVDIAEPSATVFYCLVGGILIAVDVTVGGALSFSAAVLAGAGLAVKVMDKRVEKKRANAFKRVLETAIPDCAKPEVSSYLNCVVKDVARELSRIFEYQLLQLKDDEQVKILAQCAVDLMLDLKNHDIFDRNTLLKKVLQDGKIKKKYIATKTEKKAWSAPDVFRLPGLRRIVFGKNGVEFEYFVKPNGGSDKTLYGYRGEFLESNKYGSQNDNGKKPPTDQAPPTEKEPCEGFCKKCSGNYVNNPSDHYFGKSDIDAKYTNGQLESDEPTYYPLHVLIRCPNVLDCFHLLAEKESFVSFIRSRGCLPNNRKIRPVYRPHSPGKVSDLQKSDFSGSDFSHCDFTGSCLEECDFTECIMLFAKLSKANLSGSIFCRTFIRNSDLREAKLVGCEWTATKLLYSRLDYAHLEFPVCSVGGNDFEGSNISKICTTKKSVNAIP